MQETDESLQCRNGPKNRYNPTGRIRSQSTVQRMRQPGSRMSIDCSLHEKLTFSLSTSKSEICNLILQGAPPHHMEKWAQPHDLSVILLLTKHLVSHERITRFLPLSLGTMAFDVSFMVRYLQLYNLTMKCVYFTRSCKHVRNNRSARNRNWCF